MYGENSGHLRHALGVLAREHRIQQRLGGKGTHTLPETTTAEERGELGKQIRRYRQCVLTWSLQAVRAANPRINLEGTTGRSSGPAEELRNRLTEALAASTADPAHGDELVTEQSFATVESWRQAARAAVLGEHDFSAGVGYGRLSEQQCMTVLKDAADVVRGLVALDRRYKGVPGWEKLHNQGWLGRAAEACAAHAGYDEPDYTVDRLGWQPTPQPMDGPAMPGLAGVMQAQYKLLLHLDEFPDARSLRVVMDSQRVVAHEAILRIGDVEPALAAKWTTRKQTYVKLVQETRDLGGILGKPNAAGDGAIAASRAEKLDRDPLTDTKQLRQLDRLFTHIDERVCAAVEHGIKERLYFLRVPFPRVDDVSPEMVKGPRHRYVPITSPVQTDLLAVVRHKLRPAPIKPTPPRGAAQSRLDFEAALRHRPGDPGPSVGM
jgi:hypothetical protein